MENRKKREGLCKVENRNMALPAAYVTERDRRQAQPNYVDITALIRSVQRNEGNLECFRSGQNDCDQRDCTWRYLCLE